jgi:hypothetical protein
VVIDDLDIEGITVLETETHAPLVVDADAPLAGAIALQGFEMIGKRLAQVLRTRGAIQVAQPTDCAPQGALREPAGRARKEQPFRFLVGEAPYHWRSINKLFMRGKSAGMAA